MSGSSAIVLSNRSYPTPAVASNFAKNPFDWQTLLTTTAMPAGGSISRAGNAMLYDSMGKLTYAPNNLLTYSQDLTNAIWTKTGLTSVTENSSTAPDGTNTAARVLLSSAASTHSLLNTTGSATGATRIYSVYAKADTYGIIQIFFGSDTNAYANFNVSTGVVGTVGSAATAQITSVGSGWYRCSLKTASLAASNLVYFAGISSTTAARNESWTPAGTEAFYLWGPLLEQVTYQTTPSTYVATTTAAYYGPRFDYDPSTLAAKGLLIEGTRTNGSTYSNNFAGASWTTTYSAISSNTVTSPDGSTNGSTLSTTLTNANPKAVYNSSVFANSTTYTVSIYAKSGSSGGKYLWLAPHAASSTYADDYAWFDLTTGSVGTIQSAIKSATIQNVGNGWYRCSVTFTTLASITLNRFDVGFSNADNSKSTTSGDQIYVFGSQVENGAFTTSYVPNLSTGSTARAAETFSITGYSSNLIEAYYTDEATGGSWSLPYNAGTNPSPSFSWLTSLRAYANAYAGDIASPSWIDNSGTTGNRMYYDSTGTLTWAPANMFLQSNTFNTSWTASGVTLTSGQADPFGGTAAWRLQGTTSVWALSQSMALVGDYIVSFWVKSNTGASQTFRLFGASSVLTSDLTATTDWQRFSFVFSQSATQSIGICRNVANATADLLIYGAQLERVTYQTQPRAYIPTTTAAVYQPRYDYSPATVPAQPLGMLIEESRTNLLTYSEQFNDAAWVKTRATVTANSTTAPDGTTTADKLVEDTTASNSHALRQSPSLSAVAYSFSVYAKAGERSWIRLVNASGTNQAAYFNLSSGVVGTVGASATASISSAGNGWYRCSIVFTVASAGANSIDIRLANADGGDFYTGDGISGIYLWGAQLEAGAFATSYIPTTTASVTRVADVVKLSGSALTTLQGSSASAIMEFGPVPNGWAAYPLAGTTTNTAYMRITGATTLRNTANGVQLNATLPSGSFYGTTNNRGALAFSASGRSLVANSGTVATDANVPDVPTAVNVGSLSSTYIINCVVRSLALYNQRLPDAILKSKSAVGAAY